MGLGLNVLRQSTQSIIERRNRCRVCYKDEPGCLRATPCDVAYSQSKLKQDIMLLVYIKQPCNDPIRCVSVKDQIFLTY